ncbi:DNA repair protein rad5 [Colletotrichum musicola]|uniref:DNA repair protein rad5 n=1 Tax=Colletotrichum musicola TaxID=2175873 RepID=A0A8H6MXX0_9PEZI|nr:DNA repair protein rad5 [Colletotrichum musicola]
MGVRGTWSPEHLGTMNQTATPSSNTSYVEFKAELSYFPSDGPQRDVASIDIIPHSSSLNLGLDETGESTQLTLSITGIGATIPKHDLIQFDTDTSASLDSASIFHLQGIPNLEGSIDNNSSNVEMLSVILQSPTIEVEAHCIVRDEFSTGSRKRKYGQEQSCPCMISLIVYGPLAMFDEVGDFFEKWEAYLQNPRNCARSVKHCNPHHLSWTNLESSALTSDLKDESQPGSPQMEAFDSPPDLLEILNAEEMISEAEQPRGICTPLEKHQKQALNFMARRETDSFLSNDENSLWEVRRNGETNLFINKISGKTEKQKPPVSHGGVLADPMGLVLSVWEDQLRCELEPYDVVLTTYDTVTSEWKKSFCPGFQRPVLFSATWERLILDEAHLIRNPKSQRAKAACALSASSRWAVTGTPIQNSLQDLASMLSFLRIHPYSDPKVFKSEITSLWKSAAGDEALRRLKLLVRCLFLRRPKTAIHLPSRRDLRFPLEFRPEERSFYQKFKFKAIEEIEDALVEESASTANANVLRRIDALRTICNLGTRYRETSKARRNDWGAIAQDALDVQRESGVLCCSACETRPLEIEDAVEEETGSPHHFFRCLCFICSECSERQTALGCKLACNCDQPVSCPVAPVYMGSRSKDTCAAGPVQAHERLPTKIEAVVSDIRDLNPDVKCVVFSMWRSTLDLVQTGLQRCGISSLRYDGGVGIADRHEAVTRFQEDPSLRVLVLTLSCGAVGLTLTAARRAYLMEPHWNPTQEDQALARIHRIGQTHEITTVRYFVRDTYEESVIKLQKSKRLLADVLLAKDADSHGQNRLNSLQCDYGVLW